MLMWVGDEYESLMSLSGNWDKLQLRKFGYRFMYMNFNEIGVLKTCATKHLSIEMFFTRLDLLLMFDVAHVCCAKICTIIWLVFIYCNVYICFCREVFGSSNKMVACGRCWLIVQLLFLVSCWVLLTNRKWSRTFNNGGLRSTCIHPFVADENTSDARETSKFSRYLLLRKQKPWFLNTRNVHWSVYVCMLVLK